jgi:hypothetical protein
VQQIMECLAGQNAHPVPHCMRAIKDAHAQGHQVPAKTVQHHAGQPSFFVCVHPVHHVQSIAVLAQIPHDSPYSRLVPHNDHAVQARENLLEPVQNPYAPLRHPIHTRSGYSCGCSAFSAVFAPNYPVHHTPASMNAPLSRTPPALSLLRGAGFCIVEGWLRE